MYNTDNQAGTDHPYFHDPKTGMEYEATWDGTYGMPFGYWNINGQYELYVGEPYGMHYSAFGKALQEYRDNCYQEYIEQDAYEATEFLEELANEIQQYNISYNENTDTYTSEDESYEFTEKDKLDEMRDNIMGYIPYRILKNALEQTLSNATPPDSDELAQLAIEQTEEEEEDIASKEDVYNTLYELNLDFNDTFMEQGKWIGRIWPNDNLISFYNGYTPAPNEIGYVLQDLSQQPEIRMTYQDMLGLDIIFEDWGNDNQVTACTVTQYINHDYGPNEDDDDDDDYEQTTITATPNRQTQPPIHLANQQMKRKFFQNFRDTRDKQLYIPKEKAAGSLARYNALRYPYGESKQHDSNKEHAIYEYKENNNKPKYNKTIMRQTIRLTESDLHRIIKESVNRILKERVAGEDGMTDDEVMHRRNDNFMRDMDGYPNSIHNDPYEPNYSDRIEMNAQWHTPEEMDNFIANDRRGRHQLRQNVSRGLKKGMR